MDFILGTVAPLVFEYSIGPIARHVSYPFNYKTKVASLEDGVKELKTARDDRKRWVDEHERDGKEISQVVLDWLKDVSVFIEKEEAELDLAKEKTKKKWCLGVCPNLKMRYQVSKKAEQKAEVAARFSEKNATFSTEHHIHTSALQGFSSKDFEALESRMSILEDIMKALASVDVDTIGVHGVGGVGKTTLAREVLRKAQEEKLFDEVIMVTVTIEVDVINIQKTIADFLGLHLKEESKEGRAARLCERLMKKEKKTLIILDDLWKKLKLEEVGIPQPGEHNGCKLLLTSRDLDVLSNEMGSQKVFPIGALAEDEAWDLFQKMSNSRFDDPVAKAVAKWCAGLPIAIVTVASSLKGKEIDEWKDASNKLQSTPPEELPEILAEVYRPIQFSYNQLETQDKELQPTFLLCCQMGYNATIRDLLRYGIGLGLFDVLKVEDAQCRVYTLVKELKRRCLLLEGRQLVMHDLVRDVGRWIAYHHYGVVVVADGRNNPKDWADEEKIKTYKRIWLYNNVDELQEKLQCPDLVFLHMDGKGGNLQLPHNLPKLEVLSLTGFKFSSLPSSVGSMKKSLKALSLYHSSQLGDDLSIVGGLENLEVLSFAKSNIRHLPEEIGQLTKLKLLDLSDCNKLGVIPSNVLSKLSRLEELYMANSFDRWEMEGGDNASLTELKQLHYLSNLEIDIRDANVIPEGVFSEKLCRYRIHIGGSSWHWVSEKEVGIEIVKTLKVNMQFGATHNMHNMPNGVLHLLEGTQDLSLVGVNNMPLLNGQIPFHTLATVGNSLTELLVARCQNMKYVFSYSLTKHLRQLKVLRLYRCDEMEEVIGIEEGEQSTNNNKVIEFPQLQKLSLWNLEKLKRFCKGCLLECPLLKELRIDGCPDLETIVTREREEEMRLEGNATPPTSLFDDMISFPNLKTLNLESIRCDTLWHGPLADVGNSFQNLTDLSVDGCDNMKYAFSYSLTKHLCQLKNLYLRRCKEMEEVIGMEKGSEEEDQSMNSKVILFPQLQKLVLWDLGKLKRFRKGNPLKCPLLKTREHEEEMRLDQNATPITVPPALLRKLKRFFRRPLLKKLEIDHQNATPIPPPPALFNDMVNFPSLVEIRMWGLHSMESIWDNQLAPRSFGELRKLHIEECHKLRKVLPSVQDERFQKLEELTVQSSNLVEEIFEEGGSNNHAISFQLRKLFIWKLPKLKNVFPYSIATRLQKLEHINILKSGVEEMVAAAKAEKMHGETTVCFEFPELHSLYVPDLRRMYPSMHTLIMPKLKYSAIQIAFLLSSKEFNCNLSELELYDGDESKPWWHNDFPANLLSNLKVLKLKDIDNWEGIPVSILQEFHNLEKLNVENCAFEELFSFDGSVTAEVVERLLPRLKHLELYRLEDMRYLCCGQQNHTTFHLSAPFQNLETLKVEYCDSLVSVVRPSSTTVSFQNLTSFILSFCHKLVNIVTATTAKSLSNLVTLEVRYCRMVTEIVKESEGADDGHEITFTKLQKLTLKNLESLTSFCSGNYGFSFPCLNELIVHVCPRMKLFSHHGQLLYTPKLRNVCFRDIRGVDRDCWERNLNATIRKLYTEMVDFASVKLSECPESREIWHGQLHEFPGLPELRRIWYLDVDGCPNFSIAVPFNLMPYLQELRKLSVSECDSLEGVFDFEKLLLNPDALHDELLPELRDLRLSDLPRLHHIFPTHPPPIFDFKKLGSLKLRNCSSLKNVLTTSMALCLVELQTIEIINCIALEEIITQQENAGESVAKVIFPRLRVIVLESLPNLISFNSGSGILEFSSLEKITVDKCPKMKPFISSFLRGQYSKAVDEIQPVTTTSLIDDDKVAYPKLTTLRMDWNDAMEEIGRGEFQANFFCQLRTLAIINLPDHITFPSHFLLRSHNVVFLTLENAMFEEITIHEEDTSVGSLEKLRNLTLSNLPRLVHLAGAGSPLSSILQNLETLKVSECGILETLVPSTMSFQSLTTLQVSKCHKLLSLMTCTAAKSLALLSRMIITECQMLEQIVGNEENVAGSEVTISKLECLELHCLPSLLGFSLWNCAFTFPSLKDVVVRECPKMQFFSPGVVTAPKLRRVRQTEGKEKWCWKDSLNATIQKLYEDQEKLKSSQPRSPKRSNLDVEAGQLVTNGKSHMSEGFCELKNPSVTKDLSPDTTTKHNEAQQEDPIQDLSLSIPSISQAQMDGFSTDQNKTIPPSSTEQSVHGDATDRPTSHNQQESLDKSDPAPRLKEEEVILIALLRKQEEQLRKQEEQLRTQEEKLRKQEEQLRKQEEQQRTLEEQQRTREEQLRTQEEQLRKQEEQLRTPEQQLGVSSLDQESLRKSDPVPRPREEEQLRTQEEQLSKLKEQLSKLKEQLRTPEQQLGVSLLDQESLRKSDPAPRPREDEVILIALLRKQEEQLRKQDEQLRKQGEQQRTQEEQLKKQEEQLRTQKEQSDLLKLLLVEQKTTNAFLHRQFLEKQGTSFPPQAAGPVTVMRQAPPSHLYSYSPPPLQPAADPFEIFSDENPNACTIM